jgi:hypothetical protein
MKKLTAFRFPFLALFAALTPAASLHAADTIETHWNDVCKTAAGNQLIVTTADGNTVEGVCIRINADEIAVATLDHRTIHIARTALSSLRMRRVKGHQLKALGRGMRAGLRQELVWLLSPEATLGLVALPATLAWGAVTAPFCILGDLVSKIAPERDVKLVADSTPGS